MVDLGVEERKLTITIPPRTPRYQTAMIDIPEHEVWRITEIVSLTKPSPDVELSLQINGVPQVRVYVKSIYIGDELRPSAHAFANCMLGHRDKTHFVARPLTPSKDPIRVTLRLRIQKEEIA